MKINKMLSLAAAMVLTSTSAMAFDANTTVPNGAGDSVIQTHDDLIVNGFVQKGYNPNFWATGNAVKSGYIRGTDSNVTLLKSTTNFGDALVYPAFKVADGWNTAITVTNTSSTHAVVAKVVLYASDDSRELIDFNIYLSANDVFEFKIDETGVTTIDDSIEASASRAQDVTAIADTDTVTMNTYGTKRQVTSALPVNSGYAVIYAMAEANVQAGGIATAKAGSRHSSATTTSVNATYHKEHGELFLDYRELLDACRVDAAVNDDVWRQALTSNTNMMNGMIRTQIQAPTVLATCDDGNVTNYYNDVEFINPTSSILFGSVTMSNDGASASDTRNLTLNATALSNYTSVVNQSAPSHQGGGAFGQGNPGDQVMMLWTAGEAASITDRRIKSDGDSTNFVTDLDENGIVSDASAFAVNNAYYTYSDSNLANTLHITSPVKRGIVQAFGSGSFWSSVSAGKPYGEFDFSRSIYNDQEDKYSVASSVNTGVIVSPFNPDAAVTQDAILQESLGLSNLQGPAVTANAALYQKGYVDVTFTSANYPAIVTQMSGSTVNGRALTNWFYAPTN